MCGEIAWKNGPRAAAIIFLASVAGAFGCTSETVSSDPPSADRLEENLTGSDPWKQAAEENQPNASGLPRHWIARPPADAEVVKLTAVEFGDQLVAEKDALLEKYRGKWLEITGMVETISVADRSGESQLAMPGEDLAPDHKNYEVDFKRYMVFNTAEPALWKVTSPGSKVTMRAVLARVPGAAGFDHATIVNNEGEPVPEIEAAEIARAYVTDRKACEAEYEGKAFVARGKFREYESFNQLPVLEGEGDVGVVLHYIGSNPDFDEILKPGDPLVVYGICEIDTSEIADRKVILNSAVKIPE